MSEINISPGEPKPEPMRQIICAVLRHSRKNDDAEVTNYFRKSQSDENWEGRLRARFERFGSHVAETQGDPIDEVECLLCKLDHFYHTRAPSLQKCARAIVICLQGKGFWHRRPHALFECSREKADDLARFVCESLDEMQKHTRRDYSLLTKFLHFSFPRTFAIYDSRAAKSIQLWGECAFCEPAAARQQFAASQLGKAPGYRQVLEFYRLFWQTASVKEREQLEQQAVAVGGIIDAEVSVLDLLDKLLWIANGEADLMGLGTALP